MASVVSVKGDIKQALKMIGGLEKDKVKIRRRLLRGIGSATKSKIKKHYKNVLNKQSGLLYKSLSSKVSRNAKEVVISSEAKSLDGVRYGYVLAKGATIKAKNSSVLTFQINGKWIRKHEVVIKPRDWVEGPAKSYLDSREYYEKIEALTQKEIDRYDK